MVGVVVVATIEPAEVMLRMSAGRTMKVGDDGCCPKCTDLWRTFLERGRRERRVDTDGFVAPYRHLLA